MMRSWPLSSVSGMAVAVLATAVLLAGPAGAATKYEVLHAFTAGSDGGGVYGGVTLDAKGNVYGTTTGGGAYAYGTAFELLPASGGKWTEMILHSFCSLPHCADGSGPSAGVTLDAAGNLYGNNTTVAFQLRPDPATRKR